MLLDLGPRRRQGRSVPQAAVLNRMVLPSPRRRPHRSLWIKVILPSAHYECLRPLAACSSTVRLSRELKEADMTTTELYQGSRCELE
jgi:hypothetical protein